MQRSALSRACMQCKKKGRHKQCTLQITHHWTQVNNNFKHDYFMYFEMCCFSYINMAMFGNVYCFSHAYCVLHDII